MKVGIDLWFPDSSLGTLTLGLLLTVLKFYSAYQQLTLVAYSAHSISDKIVFFTLSEFTEGYYVEYIEYVCLNMPDNVSSESYCSQCKFS